MKKTLVLTMIAVAVWASPTTAEVLQQVWLEDASIIHTHAVYDSNHPQSYLMDRVYDMASYTQTYVSLDWYTNALFRFDTSGVSLATLEDPNVTATLYIRAAYMLYDPGYGNVPPFKVRLHGRRMNTPWEGDNTNARYSIVDTQTPWADPNPGGGYRQGGWFQENPDSGADYETTDSFVYEYWTDAMGQRIFLDNGFSMAIDVKDMLTSWVDGSYTNNGMILYNVNEVTDPGDPNYYRETGKQMNIEHGRELPPYGPMSDSNLDPMLNDLYPIDPNYPFPEYRPRIVIEKITELMPHAGDVDKDGDVDIFDFMDLQGSFGATSGAVWTDGDIDPYDSNGLSVTGDGDVDIFDFMDIQANWGWSDGGGVPEPATISLLALGGLALIRRKR